MGNTAIFFESLEGRTLLSMSPAHIAGATNAFSPASVTDGLILGVKSTLYQGTATNQSGKTSAVSLVLTNMRGVRTGVMYASNRAGRNQAIAFTFNSDLSFTLKFRFHGEQGTLQGQLSADGATVTATWTSLSSGGAAGYGSVVARRV